MKDKYPGFHEKFCAECNKMIFPTSDWVYKIKGNLKTNVATKYYCSYTCYKKAGGDGYGGHIFEDYRRKR